MPISDQVKWTAGTAFAASLGFAGTVPHTVTVGTLPAQTLGNGAVLYVGFSSVSGAFVQNFSVYQVTLTLADSTTINATPLGAFQNAVAGAPFGGLYVMEIADPRIAAGGTLTFTFTLIDVVGAVSDNGVVLAVLMDGSTVPSWTHDGGYGDHGSVGRGPPVGDASGTIASGTVCGTFCPGALSDPTPFPVMSWVTRTENVAGIHVGIPADPNWTTAGFFSSAVQNVAIAMALMEPGAPFNAGVLWDTGSDNATTPWVTARNWTLTNYASPPVRTKGRAWGEIIGD